MSTWRQLSDWSFRKCEMSANHEHQSLSRATSISRASREGSTISRSQSLIKKNIAPQDLKPSDVLIERFVAWKAIVKQLIAYFEVLFISTYYWLHLPHTRLLGHCWHWEQHCKRVNKAGSCHSSPISLWEPVPGRRGNTSTKPLFVLDFPPT